MKGECKMLLPLIAGIISSVLYILYLIDIAKPDFVSLFLLYVIAMSALLILEKLR